MKIVRIADVADVKADLDPRLADMLADFIENDGIVPEDEDEDVLGVRLIVEPALRVVN